VLRYPILFCVHSAALLCLSPSVGIVVPLLSAGAVTRPLGVVAACLVGGDVAEEGLMVGLLVVRSFLDCGWSFRFWCGLGSALLGEGMELSFLALFAGLEFSVGCLEF
jgi:hypothetical protein